MRLNEHNVFFLIFRSMALSLTKTLSTPARDTIHYCLSEKKHRYLKKDKRKQQNYFNGIFFKALDKNKIDSDNSSDETSDVKKNMFLSIVLNENK